MATRYLKKARKAAGSETSDVQNVVREMLTAIERRGEAAVRDYAATLDNWKGEILVSPDDVECRTRRWRSPRPTGIAHYESTSKRHSSSPEAWSRYGVNANAIAPGFFETALTATVFNEPLCARAMAERTCIGRNGELEDLAGPAVFLASSASDYVTGQTIFVDGGFSAG
jgi:hypothetical protein